MIELRHLKYFIAVIEAESYSLAAERVFVAQSALSRQVILLEKEVGYKLLFRSAIKNMPVRPTPAGAELYKWGKKLLEDAASAVTAAQKASSGITGILRLATNRSLPLGFIPELIQGFCLQYPEIDINIKEMSPAEQYLALENDELDLGFSTIGPTPAFPLIKSACIRKDRLAVVVSKAHRFAQRSNIDIKELAEEKFVFPARTESPSYYDWLLKSTVESGFVPHIQKHAERASNLIIYVAAGFGIAFHPFIIENIPAHIVTLVPVNGIDNQVQQVLTWRKEENPLIKKFVDTALDFSKAGKY